MLVPFMPILIALSANSPIYKGQLSDHDHSHEVFARMTDDIDQPNRAARFSAAATHYISNHEYVKEFHNDQVNSVS